jgi:lipoate synthase
MHNSKGIAASHTSGVLNAVMHEGAQYYPQTEISRDDLNDTGASIRKDAQQRKNKTHQMA